MLLDALISQIKIRMKVVMKRMTDPEEKSVQSDIKCKDISLLQDEMNNISTELCKLRLEVRMNKVETEDWFDSEEKVSFYTGLPNSYLLMTLFQSVSSVMKHSSLSALIQFQKFTMTLMRLRLNLTIADDLAYRFAISTSVVILKWIDIAYNSLEVM